MQIENEKSLTVGVEKQFVAMSSTMEEESSKRGLTALVAASFPILACSGAGDLSWILTASVNFTGGNMIGSLISENKKVRFVLGAIGAGFGIICPWTVVFGAFSIAAGTVIKINLHDAQKRLEGAIKQADLDCASAKARRGVLDKMKMSK